MRAVLLTGALLVLFAATLGLRAQTNAPTSGQPPAPADRQKQALSFLSQADQDRVMSARARALADNPELKTEDDDLKGQLPGIRQASPADRMALTEKLRSHQQKMRAAMLKVDPTLGPVLDRIDKHRSEMWAKRQKAAGPTSAPATGQ